jgi:SAM-dependent methyltransferase
MAKDFSRFMRRKYQQTETSSQYSAKNELFASDRCLKNYTADIIKKMSRWFVNKRSTAAMQSKVLEFGAGIGTLAVEYQLQNKIKPDCLEIDSEHVAVIKKRGFDCYTSLQEIDKRYHVIYTSNVLEHIEDDSLAIKNLYDKLENNGYLAIFVPAFQCIWSDLDEIAGHYRRYSRKELCNKVINQRFKILSCYYVDSMGFFAWLLLRFKGYKTGDKIVSDRSLTFFDKCIYPLSRFFDLLGLRYFFGKNLLLIAKKC